MTMWRSILAPGARGSEGGAMMRDDEHDYGARISLERGGANAPFAITCGIYGWMMHTRFFAAEAQADAAFGAMKADLSAILEALPLKGEADEATKTSASMAAISAFVDKFP
ncbi:MAG TPA: hypothetical protein VG735_16445 [Caulobacterales bacterium]|nr:hypothetical protein [Caulobacterales bacterium]